MHRPSDSQEWALTWMIDRTFLICILISLSLSPLVIGDHKQRLWPWYVVPTKAYISCNYIMKNGCFISPVQETPRSFFFFLLPQTIHHCFFSPTFPVSTHDCLPVRVRSHSHTIISKDPFHPPPSIFCESPCVTGSEREKSLVLHVTPFFKGAAIIESPSLMKLHNSL